MNFDEMVHDLVIKHLRSKEKLSCRFFDYDHKGQKVNIKVVVTNEETNNKSVSDFEHPIRYF